MLNHGLTPIQLQYIRDALEHQGSELIHTQFGEVLVLSLSQIESPMRARVEQVRLYVNNKLIATALFDGAWSVRYRIIPEALLITQFESLLEELNARCETSGRHPQGSRYAGERD